MGSYLIKGGIIIDGTGGAPFIGDLLIQGDRIEEVRRTADLNDGESVVEASRRLADTQPCECECGPDDGVDVVVQAGGLVISPGFIDIHTHSDLSILAAPDASAKILQGVTTDTIGNCSIGPAPLNEVGHEYFTGWRRFESSWLERAGVQWPLWPNWSDYAEVLAEQDRTMNLVGLVAHGPVRASVLGSGDSAATAESLGEMQVLVQEAMEAGAFGLSTGLTYVPSCYADTQEVVQLCRVIAPYGGLYASHIRGEDHRLLQAVREAVQIGAESGSPVQISHHKASGRGNWGLVNDSLQIIREARSSGVDIAVDVYPYTFGGTYPGPLARIVPQDLAGAALRGWLSAHSGVADDPEGLDTGGPELAWDEVYVVEHPDPEIPGLTMAEAADREGVTCTDWFLANAPDDRVRVKKASMSETDLRTVITAPESMMGSDTYAMNATEAFTGTWLHPRNFGAFVRLLTRYVREEGLLSWEEGVRKMSSLPASRLGITDRGRVKGGLKADVAVWCPVSLEERATVGSPFSYAAGMQWVFVNGVPVVVQGQVTDNRPGLLLRKN